MSDAQEHRLQRAFLEETEELLEKLNRCLLELEKDNSNLELVHEIFRLTHSLKSEADMIGYRSLSELAHRLEDVFERLRSGALLLGRELLDQILAASDLIHEMVARIASGEGDGGLETGSVVAELERAAGIVREAPAEPRPMAAAPRPGAPAGLELSGPENLRAREALERGEQLYLLRFRVEGEALMRYPRAYLVYSNLEKAANVLKSVPELGLPPSEESADGCSEVAVLFSSELAEEQLERCFRCEEVTAEPLVRLDPQSLGRGPGQSPARGPERRGP
jgi:two-component system chemotaxis sensor kinase CheA